MARGIDERVLGHSTPIIVQELYCQSDDLLPGGFTGSQSSTWHWKSSPLTSLHPVPGWLQLYRCLPEEKTRVFLASSPEQMDVMLDRVNQGVFSTAITVQQLWDRHRTSEIEVRRLEIER